MKTYLSLVFYIEFGLKFCDDNMRMLIRRASATSNIIDVPISELAEYGEDSSHSEDETFTL